MSQLAPTFDELCDHPVVKEALATAWRDSLADDPDQRHEEGGWIYLEMNTGELSIVRCSRGISDLINLNSPPRRKNHFVVGKFHTHPNPSDEGWVPGPSPMDEEVDADDGVPDLIVSEQGVALSGPFRRRGGLAGVPGYPGRI